MCSRYPASHSVRLYTTAREPIEVWSHAFNVKYQSRAHPLADGGSLNGGTDGVPAVCCHQIVQPHSCLPRCHRGSPRPV